MDPTASRVYPLTNTLNVHLAVNVVAQNIVAKTQTGKPVSVMCDPATVRCSSILFFFVLDIEIQVENDVGFVCQNGRFVPTRAGLARRF